MKSSQCTCGARTVGDPVNDLQIELRRFGPAASSSVLLFAVAVAAMVFTYWLAAAGLLVLWQARRAMKSARRDPQRYGGYGLAAATFFVAAAAMAGLLVYLVAHIPEFLEKRRIRQAAATSAAMYQMAALLESYKDRHGSYPRNLEALKKFAGRDLPRDYWDHAISYQSYTEALAAEMGAAGIPFNNFELRSAGPDGKLGTPDDIVMLDGVLISGPAGRDGSR
jgi:hypothetical protein